MRSETLLQVFQQHNKGDKLLPVPCHATLNNGIKKIALVAGIKKKITWHTARQTNNSFRLKTSKLQEENSLQVTI